MKTIELKQLNYDELVELIKNANLLLEAKKQEKERNEIKETIMALVRTYTEKGGDREELLSSLTSSVSKESKTISENEGVSDAVLIDKEHFYTGKDKVSDYKIEEVLGKGLVSEINVNNVAASFQEAVVEVIADKAVMAAEKYGQKRIVMAGGVASNSRLRALMEEKAGRKGIPILQFTLDGDFVKEWDSASVAEVALGKGHQSIGKAVRGENNHKAGEFLWYRKNDPDVIENEAA